MLQNTVRGVTFGAYVQPSAALGSVSSFGATTLRIESKTNGLPLWVGGSSSQLEYVRWHTLFGFATFLASLLFQPRFLCGGPCSLSHFLLEILSFFFRVQVPWFWFFPVTPLTPVCTKNLKLHVGSELLHC